ncbi:MAG TPA: adenylyltransferase/cytidyltransferase family protein [Candidatus Bathyarchaeia archaeon]|nr:adenylyltransferase/cytidyltransferase family protein [Candidatus Bathyarchaeia archaeon]
MSKIVSLIKIKKILATRFPSASIVLVTGCFDLLHKAHKDFLRVAKAQADILVVGLESDKRIRQLKGQARPVNSWHERAVALAALKAVDFVFPLPKIFNKAVCHQRLLQLIKPKVLAVSENSPYLAAKKRLAKASGARIFIFPFNPRYSTTKILTPNHSCL